jgi:methionine-rich copper-binding protein CopC
MIRILAALLALPLAALGHTTLLNSSPKSGAELAQSPPAIELQFKDAVKLTAVTVTGADKSSRRLEFVTGQKPNSFLLAKPMLEPGSSEVKWTALSKDGHVVTGTLTFVVKPPKN